VISKRSITVFEHESLKVDGKKLLPEELKALQAFYGEKGVPYFTLIHNGVRFNEHVGVIQLGNTLIEVLPKADKYSNEEDWREMLIGMLRAVGLLQIHAPSSSHLKLKPNALLDLYFDMFLHEIEYLLHHGLTKKYRKIDANSKSLKGSIQFAQHIQKNSIHKERFFVRQTTYDVNHSLHQILYKAVKLVRQINTNPILVSRAATAQMWFPEMNDIKVTEATFNKLVINRKTESYRKAIEIARLLLLNFHPDVSRGRNHVLALMFDMNYLWESFVYKSIKKELQKTNPLWKISPQASKYFWKPSNGNRTTIRPDMVITKDDSDSIVVDTKWKNLNNLRPSDDDLKQMFVYHQYFYASKVALAYPGEFDIAKGNYFTFEGERGHHECSLIGIKVEKDIRSWQKQICHSVLEWISH